MKLSLVAPKPLLVFCEEGVREDVMDSVLSGIEEVHEAAGLSLKLPSGGIWRMISVVNKGLWRGENYLINGVLQPHRSIDWYIQHSRGVSGSIDVMRMVRLVSADPLYTMNGAVAGTHHKLLVLSSQLSWDVPTNLNGAAAQDICGVVSSFGLEGDPITVREHMKTNVIHELCHLYGMMPPWRTSNVVHTAGGKHCANRCVMRTELFPDDHTADRIMYGAFCPECQRDLKMLFA